MLGIFGIAMSAVAAGGIGCGRYASPITVAPTPANRPIVVNQPVLHHPLNIGSTVHLAGDVDRQAYHYFAALDAMCSRYPEQCTYRLVPGEAVVIDARTSVGNGWGYGVMPVNRGSRPNVIVAVAESELAP